MNEVDPFTVNIHIGMAPWVIMWIGIVAVWLIYHLTKRP